jgi:tetratricopeptide (TPR) repeat protein
LQGQDCNEQKYKQMMLSADSCIKAGNYRSAQEFYIGARVFCKTKADEVEKAKNNLFIIINDLRTEADSQKKLAEDRKQKAENAEKEIEVALKEAKDNNELFANYASITFNFLYDNNLNQDFINWIKKTNRDIQLDNILLPLIEKARSMDTREDKDSWIKLLPRMTSEQKAKLLNILGKETGKLWEIENKYEQQKAVIQGISTVYTSDLNKLRTGKISLEELLDTKTKKDSIFLVYLADSLKEEKQYDMSIRVYEKNLIFNPNNEDSNRGLLSIYSNQSKYKEAYGISKKLIILNPANYNYWFNLSFYALFVGKYKEAIDAANKTLELDPEQLGVVTNLALGYVLNNQFRNAEEIYLKWKDKNFPNDERLCDDIFLQDIKDLEEAGIKHKDFDKVRALFKK